MLKITRHDQGEDIPMAFCGDPALTFLEKLLPLETFFPNRSMSIRYTSAATTFYTSCDGLTIYTEMILAHDSTLPEQWGHAV